MHSPTLEHADAVVAGAKRVLATEAEAIGALAEALDGPAGAAFAKAVRTVLALEGRLMVTGVGKSGHIGRKIAATLASVGTPASFVHASEAGHGDLGMITPKDAVLALSWSGESAELRDVIDHCRRFGTPLIGFTSQGASSLGRNADVAIVLPCAPEACPMGLAPTSSTTMQLALGDALAVALLEARGFTRTDFGRYHPGGKLGAGLKTAAEIMHVGDRLPLAPVGATLGEAIPEMTRQGFGCLAVVDADGALAGILTDGDLRRRMAPDLMARPVETLMTRDPAVITPATLLSDALATMERVKITALIVVEDARPVGILHMHDLLRAGMA